jgi:hypothetical protein
MVGLPSSSVRVAFDDKYVVTKVASYFSTQEQQSGIDCGLFAVKVGKPLSTM